MGTVEPACHNGGDKELGSIGVLASIGHGQHTRLAVLEVEVLIYETVSRQREHGTEK